jgi:general secretion pathway protein M
MIGDKLVARVFSDHRAVSALAYAATIALLCSAIAWLSIDMVERYASYRDALETLAKFESRSPIGADAESESWPPGSPFLEGQTATVASATLLQQVTGVITRVGGSVVSTEVEAQAAQPKDNYLRVIATCDLEQPALQRLLHQIEAGLPFLFVDQLLVQSSATPNESSRLRVRLVVSGLWPRTK